MKQLLDLDENDCRYPMNEGGPYLFCAEMRRDEKSSYCAFHHDICCETVIVRRERAAA